MYHFNIKVLQSDILNAIQGHTKAVPPHAATTCTVVVMTKTLSSYCVNVNYTVCGEILYMTQALPAVSLVRILLQSIDTFQMLLN